MSRSCRRSMRNALPSALRDRARCFVARAEDPAETFPLDRRVEASKMREAGSYSLRRIFWTCRAVSRDVRRIVDVADVRRWWCSDRHSADGSGRDPFPSRPVRRGGGTAGGPGLRRSRSAPHLPAAFQTVRQRSDVRSVVRVSARPSVRRMSAPWRTGAGRRPRTDPRAGGLRNAVHPRRSLPSHLRHDAAAGRWRGSRPAQRRLLAMGWTSASHRKGS